MTKQERFDGTYEGEPYKPDSLSHLINIAIEDGKKMIQNPLYTPYSTRWHEPYGLFLGSERSDSTCYACLAGGVIAGSLGFTESDAITPGNSKLSETWINSLLALEDIRCGVIRRAAVRFYYGGREPRDPLALATLSKVYLVDAPPLDKFQGNQEFAIFLENLVQVADSLEELGV